MRENRTEPEEPERQEVHVSDAPAAIKAAAGEKAPVIVPEAEEIHKTISPVRARPASAQKEHPEVTVVPNLTQVLAGALKTPEAERIASEGRDLNEVVHRVLILGLVISTILMLAGLVLDVLLRRDIATTVPGFTEVFGRVRAGRPSGFLALGLLAMIATPILRVVGSICAFIYERDWRFAAITFLVLIVVSLGLLFGKG